MNLLLFKTDIATKKKVNLVKPLFNNHTHITRWTIDTEDIDNVLRIEAIGLLNEHEIINLMKNRGFNCEILTD